MSGISEGVPPTKQRKTAMAAVEPTKEAEKPLDIWQACLKNFDEASAAAEANEEQRQALKDASEPYTLFVLGDTDSGKWTLANHLRQTSGKKVPKKLPGVPLSYTYVAIDDEDGPIGGYQMNTWVIDKTDALPRFMTTALASSGGGFGSGAQDEEQEEEEEGGADAEQAGADGAEPEPEAQVEEKTDGRDAAATALNAATEAEGPKHGTKILAKMLERSIAIVCVDLEKPWTVAQSLNSWVKAVSDETKAVLAKIDAVDHQEANRVRAVLKERVQKASYIEPLAEGEAPADAETVMQRVAGDSMQDLGSSYEGVPLIVVPCKSDVINDWPRSLYYEDVHIDYVKAHLRKICLGCGAGLVYTSAKEGTNIDKLRTYLLSRVVPGKLPPALNSGQAEMDQTATYVPAGHDTVKKIDALLGFLFGTNHPATPVVLTGSLTMYPKLEQHIIADIKRLAREDADLQQSYESDAIVTTTAMTSAIKNWVAHCVDKAIEKDKDVPDELTAEVHRVLGLGLATKEEKEGQGNYIPLSPEAAAQQDGGEKINVEEFFVKLRGAAKEVSSFEWVVMDPKISAKELSSPMEIMDDQTFLENASKLAEQPDKDLARVRAATTAVGSPVRPRAGGGGDEISTAGAADFFSKIQSTQSTAKAMKRNAAKAKSTVAKGKGDKGKPKDKAEATSDMFAKMQAKRKEKK